MEKTSIIELSKPQRGLPCKSYVFLLDLDRELYLFLSYVSHSPFFDYFISSLIKRYHRSNDREKALDTFLKFSVVADEDRLSYIYPSKIFDRVSCIRLLNSLYEGVKKYLEIKDKLKHNKNIEQDEFVFYSLFQRKWLNNERLFIRQIQSSHNRVNHIIDQLYNAHLHFITKYLLKNRRGYHKIKDYAAAAYEVILEVINIYNPQRSKVPFFKLAQKYTYNYKNRIIKEETWGLGNSLIHLDALIDTKVLFENSKTEVKLTDEIYDEEIAQTDFEKSLGEDIDNENNDEYTDMENEMEEDEKENPDLNVDEGSSQTIAVKNNIWKSIESSLYYEKKQDDKLRLIEMTYQALPRPIKEVISILYEIVDPLPIEQELALAYNNKKKENALWDTE